MTANDDLLRFNAFLADEAEQEKQGRRIKRAEQAKEKAAAEVRRLDGDGRATAEQKAEAKQAYLDATDAWRREVEGEGADDPTPADADADADTVDTESSEDETADGSDDATAGEQVAEEQAAEAAGEDAAPADGEAETQRDETPTEDAATD